jgi:hypothetical protein
MAFITGCASILFSIFLEKEKKEVYLSKKIENKKKIYDEIDLEIYENLNDKKNHIDEFFDEDEDDVIVDDNILADDDLLEY